MPWELKDMAYPLLLQPSQRQAMLEYFIHMYFFLDHPRSTSLGPYNKKLEQIPTFYEAMTGTQMQKWYNFKETNMVFLGDHHMANEEQRGIIFKFDPK